MKILYFFEPWIWKATPEIGYSNLVHQLLPQINALLKSNHNLEIMCLINDATDFLLKKNNITLPSQVKLAVIYQHELRGFFTSYIDIIVKWCHKSYSETEYANMQALILDKLKGFTPDIIINYLSPAPYLETLFINALHLYSEYGFISRPPFARTYYLDAFGYFENSYIARYANQFETHIDIQAVQWLNNMRNHYRHVLEKIPSKRDMNRLTDYKRQFSQVFLLPLQFNHHFTFHAYTSHESEFDLLCDVLDHLPPDIGLVVTEHNWWGNIITQKNCAFLEATYPNLIIWKDSQYRYASQYLLLYVDAILTINSTVGIQGAFWHKPVYTIGKDNHITCFGQSQTIEGLKNISHGQNQNNRDYLFYRLMRSYYYFQEDFSQSYGFYEFLMGLYRVFQNNDLDINFYNLSQDQLPMPKYQVMPLATKFKKIIRKIQYIF